MEGESCVSNDIPAMVIQVPFLCFKSNQDTQMLAIIHTVAAISLQEM
jgi:hypothetical protein